jgi:hypothetical protein
MFWSICVESVTRSSHFNRLCHATLKGITKHFKLAFQASRHLSKLYYSVIIQHFRKIVLLNCLCVQNACEITMPLLVNIIRIYLRIEVKDLTSSRTYDSIFRIVEIHTKDLISSISQ